MKQFFWLVHIVGRSWATRTRGEPWQKRSKGTKERPHYVANVKQNGGVLFLVSFMYQSTTHCDITQPYLDFVLRKVGGVSGTKSPC